MRAEKRGSQRDSLPRQTETDRGKWENDISFRDPLKENHKEFIRQCLELRQELGRYDESHAGGRKLQALLAVCSRAQDQSCLWLVFTESSGGASWLPGVCFCIIYHTHSALQLEKESWSWQSVKAGHGTSLPLFLVSTPPPRANNRPKPRRSQWERHGEAALRMVRLVERACQDRHPPSVYSTPALF